MSDAGSCSASLLFPSDDERADAPPPGVRARSLELSFFFFSSENRFVREPSSPLRSRLSRLMSAVATAARLR